MRIARAVLGGGVGVGGAGGEGEGARERGFRGVAVVEGVLELGEFADHGEDVGDVLGRRMSIGMYGFWESCARGVPSRVA